MKIEYHLTLKNSLAIVIGVCVVLLAVIPLKVPPDQLAWLRWESAVIFLAAVAVFALLYQAHLQSKDDHEQSERNKRIDHSLAAIAPGDKQKQQLTSSNPLMRNLPHAPGTFNSEEFFRIAFYSALQDVSANSFRTEAERVRPNDLAGFYLDVLSVGFMSVHYEQIWHPLYRSQLRALLFLNGNNGIVPIGDLQKFYDEAAKEFSEYQELNVTFDNWMNYLVTRTLLKIHPSQMVEITLMGKDFLKYLLHQGRSESTKRL